MDALAVDLMGIVETWMVEEGGGDHFVVPRHQFAVIVNLMDAQFQSRTRKCVQLIGVILDRRPPQLNDSVSDLLIMLSY